MSWYWVVLILQVNLTHPDGGAWVYRVTYSQTPQECVEARIDAESVILHNRWLAQLEEDGTGDPNEPRARRYGYVYLGHNCPMEAE